MSQDKHINDLFEKPKAEFEEHLSIAGNSRIIFSGIYGIGKTYFLKRFFRSPDIEEQYEVIRLRPVNYTIASNEDILKYIKYDLLVEVILKGVQIEKLDLDLSHYLALYLKENWKEIGKAVLKTVGKIGKIKVGNVEIFEQLVEFFGSVPDFRKYQVGKKERFDEAGIVERFAEEVGKTSHLYDDTIISKIIEKKIQSLGAEINGKRKQTILYIDDLDRIDPEHIFRILNVFGAHFENSDIDETDVPNANKFNFDKVILVCDINNIRNIFHSKYGADVDFTGYIDKFYSREVFNFDIRYLVPLAIRKVAAEFNVNDEVLQKKLGEADDQAFHYIIRALFKRNAINLRSFLKFYNNPETINFRSFTVGHITINPVDNLILWQLILIKQVIGDTKSFQQAIAKLRYADIVVGDLDPEKLFRRMIFTATIAKHRYGVEKKVTYSIDEQTHFSFTVDHSKAAYGDVDNLDYIRKRDNVVTFQKPISDTNAVERYLIPMLNQLISELVEMNLL